MMDVSKRLTHTAQWATPSNFSNVHTDIYGELNTLVSTPSTSNTISCYVYQEGSKEVMFGDTILQRSNRWRVVLPPDRTDVANGDILIQVLDLEGNVVLSRGRIKDLETYRKFREGGAKAIVGTLEVN